MAFTKTLAERKRGLDFIFSTTTPEFYTQKFQFVFLWPISFLDFGEVIVFKLLHTLGKEVSARIKRERGEKERERVI